MYKVSIFLLFYFIQVVIYYVAHYVCFHEKIEKYKIPVVCGIGFGFFVKSIDINNNFLYVLVYFGALLTIGIVLWIEKKQIFQRFVILLFVVCSLEEVFRVVFELVYTYNYLEVSGELEHVLMNGASLMIFVGVAISKNGSGEKYFRKVKEYSRKYIVVLVSVMGMVMLLTVAALNVAREDTSSILFQRFSLIICGISYVMIGMLGGFTIYVAKYNTYLEKAMMYERQLKAIQKKHYDTLLEREADTKKYRHDIGNHLMCLSSLANNGDIEAVRGYLAKMKIQMENIQKKCYTTGNEVLDILTNHYTAMLKENVTVHVTGYIDIEISDMDLCTIYSNLLQNAVEELEQCRGKSFLDIRFVKGRDRYEISIRNSLSEEHMSKNIKDILKTSKDNKEEHGLGLINVRNTVESLNGIFTIKREKDLFCAAVVI